MTARSKTLAGILLVLGAVSYIAAETVSAFAWNIPGYSYLHNWISDLGSTTQGTFQGRVINSPLHDVMNAGFIIQGALFAAGIILISRSLPRELHRTTLVTAVITGLGYLLLGIFHGSATAASNGTLMWHFTGAALAIIGANTLAVILGIHWWKTPQSRRLGHAAVPLGVLGLIATLVLMLTMNTSAPSGLIETAAVYPLVLFQIRAALHLLAHRTEGNNSSDREQTLATNEQPSGAN